MKRAEQRRRTREALLEAAAEEFVTKGYAQATLQGAADRLGLTRGTVLFHFTSKEALRDALVDWGESRLLSVLEAERPGPARAGFVATVLDVAQVYSSDVRVRAGLALQDERRREHPVASAWRAALDARAAALLADARGGGVDDEGAAPVAAVALTAMFLGVLRDPAWTSERRLREALDAFTSLLPAP